MGCHQRHLEHQFLLVALVTLGNGIQNFEAPGQMCDRLQIRRPPGRAFAGMTPMLDSRFREARLRIVMG
jgi:hypothetical protein